MRRRILASIGKSALSAKSYVQDGLIAMWDGIENAGWGVHDPNATVWKDLVGDLDWILNSNGSFGENFLNVNGLSAETRQMCPPSMTVECVLKGNSGRHVVDLWSFANSNPGLGQGLIAFADGTGYQTGFDMNKSSQIWISGQAHGVAHSITCLYDSDHKSIEGRYNGSISQLSNSNYWPGNMLKSSIGTGFADYKDWEWHGMIFSLRLYSKNLSASEIAANYAIDKARFNLT